MTTFKAVVSIFKKKLKKKCGWSKKIKAKYKLLRYTNSPQNKTKNRLCQQEKKKQNTGRVQSLFQREKQTKTNNQFNFKREKPSLKRKRYLPSFLPFFFSLYSFASYSTQSSSSIHHHDVIIPSVPLIIIQQLI